MRTLAAASWTLVLLLAAPAVAAQPLQARVWFDEAPTLRGEATIATGSGGVLLLADAIARGERVGVSWSQAQGQEYATDGAEVWSAGPVPQRQEVGGEFVPRPLRWSAGSLEDFACGSQCKVYLVPREGGAVGVQGPADGPLHVTEGSATLAVTPGVQPLDVAPRRLVEGPSDGALAGPARAVFASGNLTLYLWDVQARLRTAEGEQVVKAGRENETAQPSLPQGGASKFRVRVFVVNLTDARLDAPVGSATSLLAETADADVRGSLAGARADGWAQSGRERVEVRGEAFEATGAVRAILALAPRGEGPASRPADGLEERPRGDVSGDGRLLVGGRLVGGPAAPGALPVGAAVGGSLLVVALLVVLRSGALAALYTRVTQTRVLDNPARLAVYERIRARPGAHVSELARELAIGRVVLQHHLRMLETHKLVVSRARGRVLAYFAPGSVPDEVQLAARVALKDATRRRVLDVIQRQGGATQADVAATTGLSPRLVSYHVARLEAAGLLQGDGGRPQCYRAALGQEELWPRPDVARA